MISKTEAASIRARLRLRVNSLTGEHEIYTTLLSSGKWKWFKCSPETFSQYLHWFPELKNKIEYINVTHRESGAILESLANV